MPGRSQAYPEQLDSIPRWIFLDHCGTFLGNSAFPLAGVLHPSSRLSRRLGAHTGADIQECARTVRCTSSRVWRRYDPGCEHHILHIQASSALVHSFHQKARALMLPWQGAQALGALEELTPALAISQPASPNDRAVLRSQTAIV
jgi:hypothetical protein